MMYMQPVLPPSPVEVYPAYAEPAPVPDQAVPQLFPDAGQAEVHQVPLEASATGLYLSNVVVMKSCIKRPSGWLKCVNVLFTLFFFKVTSQPQSLHPCPTGQCITQWCQTLSASSPCLALTLWFLPTATLGPGIQWILPMRVLHQCLMLAAQELCPRSATLLPLTLHLLMPLRECKPGSCRLLLGFSFLVR